MIYLDDDMIIYRIVGKILRSQGASKIYILNSKTIVDGSKFTISLEIIADQMIDYAKANRMVAEALSDVKCTLIQDDHPDYYDLFQEAEQDGIQL